MACLDQRRQARVVFGQDGQVLSLAVQEVRYWKRITEVHGPVIVPDRFAAWALECVVRGVNTPALAAHVAALVTLAGLQTNEMERSISCRHCRQLTTS